MKYIRNIIKKILYKDENKIKDEIILTTDMHLVKTSHEKIKIKKVSDKDIKGRIERLINDNEKYFIFEITRTTLDAITSKCCDLYKLKTMGYVHRISAEMFEKYGIFLYVTDLSEYKYAPRSVKYELAELIDDYGVEKVTEEIAIYLKYNYSDKFGIKVVCYP